MSIYVNLLQNNKNPQMNKINVNGIEVYADYAGNNKSKDEQFKVDEDKEVNARLKFIKDTKKMAIEVFYYYNQDIFSGSLDYKKTEKGIIFTGSIKDKSDNLKEVALFTKTSSKGTKYFSLKIEEPIEIDGLSIDEMLEDLE